MKKQIAVALASAFVMSTAATVMAAPVTGLVTKATFGGDLRIRYDLVEKEGRPDLNVDKYRLRFNVGYKFNDNLSAKIRLVNGENEFADTSDDHKLAFDNYYITYKIPGYTMTAGRQDLKLFEGFAVNTVLSGEVAIAHEDQKFDPTHPSDASRTVPMFEGLIASHKFGNLDTTVFFGQQNAKDFKWGRTWNTALGRYNDDGSSELDTHGIAVKTQVEKFNFGAAFIEVGAENGYNFDDNLTIFSVNTMLGKVYAGGEYVWGLGDTDNKAWTLVASYGTLKNAGDINYKVQYRSMEKNALSPLLAPEAWRADKYKFWSVEASQKLAKDLTGKIYYEDYNFPAVSTQKDFTTLRGELVLTF